MPYKFFQVPVRDSELEEKALNGFLGSHRIVAVSREFLDVGENSRWCFCIEFLPGVKESEDGRRNRVDYREVLAPEEFALFAKLRDLRKELAQAEAIPVFTIFTNDQLAQIVRERAATKAALSKVSGLGEARLEKYGERVAKLAGEHWREHHEAGRGLV